MRLRQYRYLQFLALTGLGLFILEIIVTGKLSWYIHKRYLPLTILAAIGILGMGLAALVTAHRMPREAGSHDPTYTGWGLAIALLPLLVGWAIPSRPLSAMAIDSKGVSVTASLAAGGRSSANFGATTGEHTILDWIRLFNSGKDYTPFLGQEADVIGFVYHDPRLDSQHFLVSRFAIVCCAADAFAIGMAVQWPDNSTLAQDTWVKVQGAVQEFSLGGDKLPLILATSVEPVSAPSQPYLFP